MTDSLTIATDGSSAKDRRGRWVGGWAYVREDGMSRCAGQVGGTNNWGELSAIRYALEDHPDADLVILADSQYAIKSLTQWLRGWKRRGWVNSAGRPVANRELIETIDTLLSARRARGVSTEFRWVKAHAGHDLNERVDDLARSTMQKYLNQ